MFNVDSIGHEKKFHFGRLFWVCAVYQDNGKLACSG